MKRLLFLPLVAFSTLAFCQNAGGPTPAQTLRLARATYEQGRLHEIQEQLNEGVVSQMAKADKVEAYKLLCLAYIYLEESAKADESMLNILRTDPYFIINEAVDPAELVALYKTFRTRPIYRFGAKLGVNAARPNISESVEALNLTGDSKYKFGIGLLFGGIIDLPINDNITLHGELLFLQRKYKVDLKVNRGVDEFGNSLINEFNGIESQSWLSLPLSFEYRILEKNYNPYIAAGVSVDYLLTDKLVGVRTRASASSIPEASFELERQKVNISAMAAAGVKIKLAGGYFVAEVRYLYGITKVNSEKTAYANQEATWELGYADSIFKLSSLALTGSYVQNIFNPKKLKHKK